MGLVIRTRFEERVIQLPRKIPQYAASHFDALSSEPPRSLTGMARRIIPGRVDNARDPGRGKRTAAGRGTPLVVAGL